MAYVKQTWSNGETLSAAKLKHLHDGIYKSNILYVTITTKDDEATDSTLYFSDVPFEEVKSSILAGRLVLFKRLFEFSNLVAVGGSHWAYNKNTDTIWIDSAIYFDVSGIYEYKGEIIR